MKKLFVIVLAAIGMVSCMNTDEVIEVNNDNAIAFADAFIENSVRATAYDNNTLDHFNVWGTVTAGQPILAVENIESYFPIPMDYMPNQETFMLKVKGESMINAGIFDGDTILVQKQSHAKNGDFVVALIEDSVTVKTFYKENDYYRLQPENDYMDPIIVPEVEILGKVIGLFRMFR